MLARELQRLDLLFKDHLDRTRGAFDREAPSGEGTADRLLRELWSLHEEQPAAVDLEPAPPRLPGLAEAARVFGLTAYEQDIVMLALAIELEPRYGRLVAQLEVDARARRPSIATIAAVLRPQLVGDLAALAPFDAGAPLLRYALVEVRDDAPLASRRVALEPSALRALVEGVAREAIEPGEATPAVREAARWLAATRRPLVVIDGPPGSGRGTLARSIAAAAGYGVESATVALGRIAARDAMWRHHALVVEGDAGEPAAQLVAQLVNHDLPLIWIAAPGATERLVELAQRPAIVLRTAPLDTRERVELWASAMATIEHDSVDVAWLAERFHFGPERVCRAVALAGERAAMRHGARASLTLYDLESACRSLPAARVDGLGQRIACAFDWEDLVIAQTTRDELELAVTWIRSAATVRTTLPMGNKLLARGGLTCLFSGPPGTGKTMAAQVLAKRLGLDLVRVDLSAVVSKWIGETEKHLGVLFDEASAGNFVLFFDEADALFGKRTNVERATDRYANVETGYLLQRLESHDGISILATNLRRNLDEAFLRRFQIVAEFPPPTEIERTELWRRLLPTAMIDVDARDLARFQLSGGEIRNVVVAACMTAAGQPLTREVLHVALRRELRKNGRLIDPADFAPRKAH